ncbi:MAG: hypothetical protein QOK40_653 [Miltoncostaeaceae bacterium]|nr:hypothetical protein [Miltoncostaeaceae bacterium]
MRPWPAPLRGTPHRWTLSTPSSTSASPSPARTSCSTPAPVLPQVAARLAQTFGGSLTHLYSHAVIGFSIRLSEDSARALALDPLVALVEEDGVVRASATQTNPPWGLDRIDQRDLPLDDAYRYASEGAGVTAYVIDTGIRVSHQEFGGRASVGIDTVGDGQNGADCAGHGTHVAATIGGATYGVAKSVRLVAVRVLDCAGGGESSDVIAGVDWVTAQPGRPAVANMSLGSSGSDTALETAVRNSIADGITYAIASGNDNNDACNHTPARVAEAITVNASTVSDWKASFSNFGPCTDIFAPGSSILSAWNTSIRPVTPSAAHRWRPRMWPVRPPSTSRATPARAQLWSRAT